jgi:putative membrane protein insertion efficiency factor
MIRAALIGLVKGYRLLLSPWLGSSCRFTPTCSAYSLQAFEQHGAAAGSYLTLARLVRCHPWCEGGHDPVPDMMRAPTLRCPPSGPAAPKPHLFTHLLSPFHKKKSS